MFCSQMGFGMNNNYNQQQPQQQQSGYGFGGMQFNKPQSMMNQQNQPGFGFNTNQQQNMFQQPQQQFFGQQNNMQQSPYQQPMMQQSYFQSFNSQIQEQLVYCGKIQQQQFNGYVIVCINGGIYLMDQSHKINQIQNLNKMILSADYQNNILVLGTEIGSYAYNFQFNQIMQLDQQYTGIVSKVQFVEQNIVACSIVSLTVSKQLDLANPKQTTGGSMWGSNSVQLSPIPKYKLVFFDVQNGKQVNCNAISSSYASNGQFCFNDGYIMIPQNPNYASTFIEIYKVSMSKGYGSQQPSFSVSKQQCNIPESALSSVGKDFIISSCCLNAQQKVAYVCGYNGQIVIINNVFSAGSNYSSYSYRYQSNYGNNSNPQVNIQSLQIPILSCASYINDICFVGTQNGQIFVINQQFNPRQLQQVQIPVTYLAVDKSQMNTQILYIGCGLFQQSQQKMIVCCQIQGQTIEQIQIQ